MTMPFSAYYRQVFRGDLNAVLAQGWRSGHEGAVQPRMLSTENPVIAAMSEDRLGQFAAALYFTVLVDDVVHKHFRAHYESFHELTRYPKLLGDCPGGCDGERQPSYVLGVVGERPGGYVVGYSMGYFPRFRRAVTNAAGVMQREVIEFFDEYLPDVDGRAVWERCLAELPEDARPRHTGARHRPHGRVIDLRAVHHVPTVIKLHGCSVRVLPGSAGYDAEIVIQATASHALSFGKGDEPCSLRVVISAPQATPLNSGNAL